MTKAELGTKRACPNCGAKYYDLNKSPIVCPRCGTVFEVTTTKARPQTAAPKAAVVEEEEQPEAEAAEVISLGEADEEATESGQVKAETVGDDDDDDDTEIEGGDDDDDTFLEEDEEDDEDVGGIIGDVDEEER